MGLISGALGGGLVGVAAFFIAKDLTQKTPPQAQFDQETELEGGIIRLSVTSDGTTGEEWINRLEEGGYNLNDEAKQVLKSDKFNPTNGITYEVVILRGELFSDGERSTKTVRVEAEKRNLQMPNAEVAPLLREKLTDEELQEMGLEYIMTMHERIENLAGDMDLLNLFRLGGSYGLYAREDWLGFRWPRNEGFAFIASR